MFIAANRREAAKELDLLNVCYRREPQAFEYFAQAFMETEEIDWFMMERIRAKGVITPCLVRQKKDGRYELNGGYDGDDYTDDAWRDAEYHFSMTESEIEEAWTDYDANMKAMKDFYGAPCQRGALGTDRAYGMACSDQRSDCSDWRFGCAERATEHALKSRHNHK